MKMVAEIRTSAEKGFGADSQKCLVEVGECCMCVRITENGYDEIKEKKHW